MKKVTYYDDILSGDYTLLDTASFKFKKEIEESGRRWTSLLSY